MSLVRDKLLALLPAAGQPGAPPPAPGDDGLPPYCELHCLSNFSFLRGASHAEELVKQAVLHGYAGLAITDECSLAGVVRAYDVIRGTLFRLIIGSEFRFTGDEEREPHLPHSRIVLLAQSLTGYQAISALITYARLKADKGSYEFYRYFLKRDLRDCLCLYVPDLPVRSAQDPRTEEARVAALSTDASEIAKHFPDAMWIACEMHAGPNDAANRQAVEQIAQRTGLPIVATGGVRMHDGARRQLLDTMTAIRLNVPVAQCGHALLPNGQYHLRDRGTLAALYKREWMEETMKIVGQCGFELDQIKYTYPEEMVPPGETAASYLRKLAREGLEGRYPKGVAPRIRAQMEKELDLIEAKKYEAYFLTVHDIVKFARGEKILCQGRGSAANSVVCYALRITAVDPTRSKLMFARFISKGRDEPPDIDVDFEHERREEVIQHLYAKYGRHRAALAAAVSIYRPRGALRDVGKALGLSTDQMDVVSKNMAWWDGHNTMDVRVAESGLDLNSPVVRHLLDLSRQLMKNPRHLSQHSGGFVLSNKVHISSMVPVENAAMADRTVIQWDKNDLELLGLMKVDVLGLGMLTLIRRAVTEIGNALGTPFSMDDIPKEDPEVYDMLCAGESMGVFQVESRAQMSMLPRLQPRRFYDLVIEVAIVRPGPIQGGMVHPYLKRRQGLEPVRYPSIKVRKVLKRTLGVSIFQEQVMRLAVVAAGFSESEADDLRRAMAAWKRKGGLEEFEGRLKKGMTDRKYTPEYADQIYKQMQGFGEYGFPESHANSFALLVYISSWLKRHEPAIFLFALLNSQPLGFYAPSQLIQDAQRNGVDVLPVDVNQSHYDATLEQDETTQTAWKQTFDARMMRGDFIHPEDADDDDSDDDEEDDGNGDAGGEEIEETKPEIVLPGHYEGTGELRINTYPPAQPYQRNPQAAVRLGLRKIANLSKAGAERLVKARGDHPYTDIHDLTHRAHLDRSDLEALAAADALASISGHRRRAVWDVIGVESPLPIIPATATPESDATLTAPSEGEDLMQDYATLSLTLRRHPLALLRPMLAKRRLSSAAELRAYPHGRLARACGIVTGRQRPGTAKGTIFVTLEDETGYINVVCWNSMIEQFRREILTSRLMTVYGVWETDGKVAHLIAKRIVDDTALLGRLQTPRSRDFH